MSIALSLNNAWTLRSNDLAPRFFEDVSIDGLEGGKAEGIFTATLRQLFPTSSSRKKMISESYKFC